MSTIRVGSSEKYASNWDKAFGGGKSSASKATKKAAPNKAVKKKAKKK